MALSRGSRWFLAAGMVVLAGVAAALWWLDERWFVDSVEPGQALEYTVERGQTVRSVADDLADLGVVRSAIRFRLAADDAGLARRLQPGVFELETGMDNDAVLAVLAAGPIAPPSIRFTVPEGLSVVQTLERLAEAFPAHDVEAFAAVLDERREAGENAPGLLRLPDWVPEPADAGPDVEPFEGLLWPQTYDVDDDAPARAVLQLMVDQLVREMASVDREGLDDAGRYELLVVGSLIERETRVDSERPTVAGVITNRLAEGMRLQIDATVVYALGGGPRDIVLLEDLEVDSPYNTYRIDGLPPTPISGVGTAALRAAAEPAEVPFRFYVLDPACDGSHRFAETGAEHQVNVQAFRDAGRCQQVTG